MLLVCGIVFRYSILECSSAINYGVLTLTGGSLYKHVGILVHDTE